MVWMNRLTFGPNTSYCVVTSSPSLIDGMGLEDVVRLEERLDRGLPVGRQALADVDLDEPVLEAELGEVVGEHAQVAPQRLCLLVEVDEHEPDEGVDGHFEQRVRSRR